MDHLNGHEFEKMLEDSVGAWCAKCRGPQRDGHYIVTEQQECVQGLGWSTLFYPQYLVLLYLFKNGSWDFVPFGLELPQLRMHTVIFSPI